MMLDINNTKCSSQEIHSVLWDTEEDQFLEMNDTVMW